MVVSSQNNIDNIPKHVVCFVALPFTDKPTFAYHTVLLPALREVLELAPYYWQVGRADDSYFKDTIYENVAFWMNQAHAYIADISDLNPNVLLELGYMYWGKKPGQPLIILERSDAPQNPVDLAGVIRIRYPAERGNHAIEDVALSLKEEFGKRQDIQRLNAGNRHHYLSSLLLSRELRLNDQLVQPLTREYVTMEALNAANIADICQRVPGLRADMARIIQKSIKDLLGKIKSY